MAIDKGLEKIGDIFKKQAGKPVSSRRRADWRGKPAPAYAWQDLALRVIKELNIPDFKKSAVFKVCKEKPRNFIEKCLNDTKELSHSGEKWKYFFKLIAGGKK